MSVTVDLPEKAFDRLEVEANRRGVTVGDLIAELAGGLTVEAPPRRRRRLAFAGIGASGGARPARDGDRWLGEGFGLD